MKIAIISSGFLPVADGVSISLFYRVQKLSQCQHHVLLLCPDYSALEDIYPNWKRYTGQIFPGVRVVSLPSSPALGLDFERDVSIRAYPVVLKELARFKPDIIHVDEPERLSICFLKIAGVNYAKKTKIPCVSFFHTNYIDYVDDYFNWPFFLTNFLKILLKFLFSWIYNSYDMTLISSHVTYQKVRDYGIRNSRHGEFLGFDLNRFNSDLREPTFFEKNYNLKNIDSTIKIAFLGRLTPDKGWHFLFETGPELFQSISTQTISLMIAGEGPMHHEIYERLIQWTPKVYLLGRLAPEKVPAFLANCDIYITNSEKETKGLTVLEALASGIPVLAPRAGGLIDSIRDGVNGYLYNPQEPQDFIKKLTLLIENDQLRTVLQNNAPKSVVDLTWDNAVNNLLQVWETLLMKSTGESSNRGDYSV